MNPVPRLRHTHFTPFCPARRIPLSLFSPAHLSPTACFSPLPCPRQLCRVAAATCVDAALSADERLLASCLPRQVPSEPFYVPSLLSLACPGRSPVRALSLSPPLSFSLSLAFSLYFLLSFSLALPSLSHLSLPLRCTPPARRSPPPSPATSTSPPPGRWPERPSTTSHCASWPRGKVRERTWGARRSPPHPVAR